MKYGIKTLDDIDIQGKTVLCRIDINEPVDRDSGCLQDITRLEACVPTIEELCSRGGRVVLLAHQGNELAYHQFEGLERHGRELSRLLGRELPFADDICGPAAQEKIQELTDGDVLLLENVRLLTEESILFERHMGLAPEKQAGTYLVRTLAPLADVYVCDAFAAIHRNQPSLCGFPQVLPSAMGRLFERELGALDRLTKRADHPCVYVLGGAKVADSLQLMQSVLESGLADQVLVGGLVGLVLLWADGYDIGSETRGFIEALGFAEMVEMGHRMLGRFHGRVVLPTDCAYTQGGARREAMLHALPPDALVMDIGAGSTQLFRNIILEAGTVFVNGPMGVYEEPFGASGTRTVWEALGDAKGYTVIVGNNSIAATRQYEKMQCMDHISTGGWVFSRLLSGEESPVIQALLGNKEITV